MPAVPAPAKVLISGVNGYVGAWVAAKYLEHGYSVRGTVRSIEKAGKHLYDTFSKYGDKFELVEVKDITAKGAFDDAVKGVDIVAHTASPFHFNFKVPEDIIDPALKGTTSILESIHAHAPTVKRVVLTASIVSIWSYFVDKPTVFTEEDWNDQAVKLVEEKGADAGGAMVYGASKTLAERAAWKFREDNHVSWDLAVINPPYVYGPPINEVNNPESLGTSQKMLFDILTGAYSTEQYETTDFQYIDVRDVAEVHVRAAEIEQAGNTRALISREAVYGQDLLDVANAISPKPYDGIPVGNPGSTKDKAHAREVSIEQFKRIYGFELHTAEDIISDSIADFKKRGWIQ
ncbi:D-lactaldehyde dehydrogenase [Peniophora sp. CONT]|nr:D-lactaldehyde dehydrogenase [Peniophora sp. CONT]